MIIVRLCGGLGNQMFQYAAGLAAAHRIGSEVKFDTHWFDATCLHQGLELRRVFGLELPEPSSKDLRKVLGACVHPAVRRLLSRRLLRALRPKSLVIQPHFHYWTGFEHLTDNVYLEGYWQSERYFSNIADIIRQQFRFVEPLDPHNAALMDEMQSGVSVSLHIRRGDYFNNPQMRRVHGVDLSEYYPAAVATMIEKTNAERFYVFSDDPQWVLEHLKLPVSYTVVDHNRGAASYRDMQLMSACRHHIIANSTFSWWGAWLNPRPDKVVIAPRHWFNVDVFDTRDLYCPEWIVL
ncbi:alpha-1,2-fucosyltransferase [Thermosynechococcus vestitus]|uniref:Tlr2316 protein n=1 Tax=Thermosynechococcus vestitus (strain NIES-2133 / IAM M-273 / BP-1) TaxID=197221 RepID=Q8DGK1_THEVB|nr:alpha-1,2-fucosyltransferase [Thermosynechococcus vestitus]BAC09868.1 tlr2316 [Thermosynechococcus vestitus BP-1]